ncbi:MAG: spinster family MFS transporter [Gemmataceae bacterium]
MRNSSRLAFTLGVLLAVNAMNFYDRQVLAAVQEKIRAEWRDISDSALGALGTAFIVLYAAVGLPLGRLADVGRRKWLLAAGVAVWSLLTILSGFAWSFWSLFVFRLGVGIGEATCAPVASSLIGDLVPAQKRARAMALFMLGLPIGLALSFFVSGAVADLYGWKEAFFVAGAPGLLLAGAALFIAEPARGSADAGPAMVPPPFAVAVRKVLALPTMGWLIASGALHNFNMYALGTFVASFLHRYHHVSLGRAGVISGVVYGCGAVGIFAGGWLGDRLFHRGVANRLRVAWVGSAAAIPFLLLYLGAPAGQVWLSAAGVLPACVLMYAYYGTVYATIQDIVPPALRGTAMAVYFGAMYLFGALWGPLATGRLSDFFAARAAAGEPPTEIHKAVGLHDALYIIPILDALLVLVLMAAARTVPRDHQRRLDAEKTIPGADS